MVKKAIQTVDLTGKALVVNRDREMLADELLSYDIAPSPVLFTEEGFMTKSDKSHLIFKFETFLTQTDCKYVYTEKSCFVVMMANVCKIRTVSLSDF